MSRLCLQIHSQLEPVIQGQQVCMFVMLQPLVLRLIVIQQKHHLVDIRVSIITAQKLLLATQINLLPTC